MCYQCKTKPVYEFTNQRKLCKNCFIRWFGKKFLYTVRKFNLVDFGDVVGYVGGTPGRIPKKGTRTCKQASKNIPNNIFTRGSDFRSVVLEDCLRILKDKGRIEVVEGSKKVDKVAVSITIDLVSYEIINKLVNGDIKRMKISPVEGKIIKPLFLFLDEEVLLYCELKGLKFKEKKEGKDKISKFIDELEKKHPEVKQAVVKGMLKLS
ncbi:MAG: hypothetical protein ABIA78_01975 [archaeon]